MARGRSIATLWLSSDAPLRSRFNPARDVSVRPRGRQWALIPFILTLRGLCRLRRTVTRCLGRASQPAVSSPRRKARICGNARVRMAAVVRRGATPPVASLTNGPCKIQAASHSLRSRTGQTVRPVRPAARDVDSRSWSRFLPHLHPSTDAYKETRSPRRRAATPGASLRWHHFDGPPCCRRSLAIAPPWRLESRSLQQGTLAWKRASVSPAPDAQGPGPVSSSHCKLSAIGPDLKLRYRMSQDQSSLIFRSSRLCYRLGRHMHLAQRTPVPSQMLISGNMAGMFPVVPLSPADDIRATHGLQRAPERTPRSTSRDGLQETP